MRFQYSVAAVAGLFAMADSFAIVNQYRATFDDIAANPALATTQVNKYDNLYYQGFTVANNALNQGLRPNTSPNTIVFSDVQSNILNGGASITSQYDSSNVLSFDLLSLFFGCTLATQETLVNEPTTCDMVFTARDSKGNELATRTEHFASSGQMQQVTFGLGFKNAYRVDISISGLASGVTAVGVLDTINYITHNRFIL